MGLDEEERERRGEERKKEVGVFKRMSLPLLPPSHAVNGSVCDVVKRVIYSIVSTVTND